MGSLPPKVVEDCLGIVQVFSDGSISRSEFVKFPMEVEDDGTALWKDCLYDNQNNLHLRLYKPRSATSSAPLPVLLFLHGGGFCVGSRTWPNCHSCCLRLASALHALVVAPDYRLAPEHRLPAAAEDARASLEWLQQQALMPSAAADEWLREGIDFGRVFVVGDSSGGNLAHHLAVELRPGSPGLAPVRVRGYVLMAPFFGGVVRTKSEAEGPPEKYLNLEILDRFWRLSIPSGETLDHPFANPFGPSSPRLDCIKLDPMLVLVGGSEVMRDRIDDYSKRLKEMGKEVDYVEYKGEQHGFFVNQPFSQVAYKVLEEIKRFITKNSL
ncbi:probable carboxylesterase 15 [Salvia hispanica]|uniref:probable carboxylesterase 15 n=1 Tax=Salvia hispanica TaxID=49212 RepID=UPI002009437A|nr:probable carboxylesterase 15 [Salvia hispanica]